MIPHLLFTSACQEHGNRKAWSDKAGHCGNLKRSLTKAEGSGKDPDLTEKTAYELDNSSGFILVQGLETILEYFEQRKT